MITDDAEENSFKASEDSAMREYMDSNRFSVIENSRTDSYAEDVVIQKVIHYISLFDLDIYKAVKGSEDYDRDELQDVVDEEMTKSEDLTLDQMQE